MKWFGKWLEVGRATKSETWHKTIQGHKLEGTDYNRTVVTILEINDKSGKLRATRGYSDSGFRSELDPEFAIQEINCLGGNIRFDILSQHRKTEGKNETRKFTREQLAISRIERQISLLEQRANSVDHMLKVINQRLDEITFAHEKVLGQADRLSALESQMQLIEIADEKPISESEMYQDVSASSSSEDETSTSSLTDDDPDICPCTKDCELHGNCNACQERHHSQGQLTACETINLAKR